MRTGTTHGGFEKAARSLREEERGREAPLRSRRRRADARFEWLIFFLLFARPPLDPAIPPSNDRVISRLSSLRRGRNDQRFDGGHLAANYD